MILIYVAKLVKFVTVITCQSYKINNTKITENNSQMKIKVFNKVADNDPQKKNIWKMIRMQ